MGSRLSRPPLSCSSDAERCVLILIPAPPVKKGPATSSVLLYPADHHRYSQVSVRLYHRLESLSPAISPRTLKQCRLVEQELNVVSLLPRGRILLLSCHRSYHLCQQSSYLPSMSCLPCLGVLLTSAFHRRSDAVVLVECLPSPPRAP